MKKIKKRTPRHKGSKGSDKLHRSGRVLTLIIAVFITIPIVIYFWPDISIATKDPVILVSLGATVYAFIKFSGEYWLKVYYDWLRGIPTT